MVHRAEYLLGNKFSANEGDQIQGVMERNGEVWNISITNLTTQQSTQIDVTEIGTVFDWVALALEGANPVSDIFNDNDVCGTVRFTDIEIDADPPVVVWGPVYGDFPLLTGLDIILTGSWNCWECTLYTNGGNPTNPTIGLISLPVDKAEIILSLCAFFCLPILGLYVVVLGRRYFLLRRTGAN